MIAAGTHAMMDMTAFRFSNMNVYSKVNTISNKIESLTVATTFDNRLQNINGELKHTER